MRVALIGAGRIGGLHAATLRDLPEVEALLIVDADAALARSVAAAVGADAVGDVDVAFKADLDAVVIAAATAAHPELVHMALDARLPVFCEKPVASDVAGTREVVAHAAASGTPLHVGFQRRFDVGYRAVREAIRSGRLGWVHTLRACTSDAAPPATSYLRGSGGIFRDCLVHDFDAIRWVTGREVVEVYATGANRGDPGIAEAGDVDTAAAVLTLDDGTIATVTATRYNGAGYDVRLEACGSRDSVVAGLDDRTPLRRAEAGSGRAGPGRGDAAGPYQSFLDRFRDAYLAELRAFTEMAAGRIASPCTAAEALEALLVAEAADLSRREHRPVRVEEVRDAR